MFALPVDAIPDLSDVQVIVVAEWEGQNPQVIEDQVTQPLSSALLNVASVRDVRAQSYFGVAFVYAIPDLPQVGTFTYDGEGWGLCDDGSRLIMSDGTDRLTFRDRATFEVVGSVAVSGPDGEVSALNELECVDGEVYANVYQTDTIVRIDPTSGRVTAAIDASSLSRSITSPTWRRLVPASGSPMINPTRRPIGRPSA